MRLKLVDVIVELLHSLLIYECIRGTLPSAFHMSVFNKSARQDYEQNMARPRCRKL